MRKVLYLLGQLADNDVEWLARAGERRDLAAGTVLIRRGQPITDFIIVLTGRLVVLGDNEAEIARLGAGEIVGEMSLLDHRPPSATARALEATTVLAIDRRRLQQKLEADTAFAARFYRALALFLSDRMRSTLGRLGYGKVSIDEEEELPEALLDNLHLAGARFEAIMRRLLAPV